MVKLRIGASSWIACGGASGPIREFAPTQLVDEFLVAAPDCYGDVGANGGAGAEIDVGAA
jgi:hypothetical protein